MTMKTKASGVVLGTICAFVATSAFSDTFRLRVGSGHPAQGVSHMEAFDQFFLPEVAKRVEERTDHEIKWSTSYAGSLAKLPEMLNATRTGLLDIGVVNYAFHPSELFLHTFPYYLPFNSGDAVQAIKAMRMTYDRVPWLKTYFEEEYNQKLLGLGANGNYGIGTNFPFEKYEDLNGKRISAAGPNLELLRGGNVTPVNSPAPEAYNSIKSGVYDGAILFPGFYYSLKLGEVAPYFTTTGLGSPTVLSININLDTWNELPPEIQEILVEVGNEYEEVSAIAANKDDEEGLKGMAEDGVTVIPFPDEEKVKWAANLIDLPNEKAQEANSRGLPGTEVFNAYIQALTELGYEWPQEYKID